MINISEKEGNYYELELVNTMSNRVNIFMIDKDLFDLSYEERNIFNYSYEELKEQNTKMANERKQKKTKIVGMHS